MPRTVLLADDSVTAQNMGRRILTDAGYEVITVNNGSAALKKVHERPPDLIVLDVYMPGYGGLEVCQRLKESGATMKIPVLLTVGKMEPFKPEEAKRVRADGHIVKPFDASELLAALTKLEDQIVPQPEPTRSGRGKKSEHKKTRFWQVNHDPATDPVGDPSGEIARLAELKRREQEQPPAPAEESGKAVTEELSAPKLVASAPVVVEEMAVTAPPEEVATAGDESSSFAEGQATATFASAAIGEVEQTSPEAKTEFSATPPEEKTQTRAEPAEAESEPPAESPSSSSNVASAGSANEAPSKSFTKPRWVAETVALSAEEASIALDQEMQKSQAVSPAPVAEAIAETTQAQAEPTPAITADAAPVGDEKKSGAAFAAAAGSSAGALSQDAVGSAPAIPAAPEPEPAVTAEAAAAWENWQQIRDSVISTQPTEAIAESVAEVAKASLSSASENSSGNSSEKAESNASESTGSSQAAPAPQLEGEALASIVDSVLAELKPKLMAEIAKKLSVEKK